MSGQTPPQGRPTAAPRKVSSAKAPPKVPAKAPAKAPLKGVTKVSSKAPAKKVAAGAPAKLAPPLLRQAAPSRNADVTPADVRGRPPRTTADPAPLIRDPQTTAAQVNVYQTIRRGASALGPPPGAVNPVVVTTNNQPPEAFRLQELRALPEAELLSIDFMPVDPEVLQKQTFRIDQPIIGTGRGEINDERMGVNLQRSDTVCATCGLNARHREFCTGHAGHIVLPPRGLLDPTSKTERRRAGHYYNPIQVRLLVSVLHSICPACGELKISRTSTDYLQIRKLPSEQRLHAFEERLKKLPCTEGHCRGPNYEFDVSDANQRYVISSSGRPHHPEEVYGWIAQIKPQTAEDLGFVNGNHPKFLFLSVVPVVPPCQRPVAENSNSGITQHPTTMAYYRLLKAIQAWDSAQHTRVGATSALTSEEADAKIDEAIIELFVRQRKTEGAKNRRSTAIIDEMNGKQGTLRRHVRGANVGNSARAVIVPDRTLNFDEVGVPWYVVTRLNHPVDVTGANRDELQEEVDRGAFRRVERGAESFRLQAAEPWILRVGDRLFRQLQAGDLMEVWRPPSLSANNFRMLKARVLPRGKHAFRLRELLMKGYHGDYDGDALGLTAVDPITAAALDTKIGARNCAIDPNTSETLIGAIQDPLIAWFIVTRDWKKEIATVRKVLDDQRAKGQIPAASLADRESRLDWLTSFASDIDQVMTEAFDEIVTKIFGSVAALAQVVQRPGWARATPGQKLFSTLLPEGYNYEYSGVAIRMGVLFEGALTDEHIGNKFNTIVADIKQRFTEQGVEFAENMSAVFAQNLSDMGSVIMGYIGYTVNPEECIIQDSEQLAAAQEQYNILRDALRRIQPPTDPAHYGQYEEAQRKILGQTGNLQLPAGLEYASRELVLGAGAKGLSRSIAVGPTYSFGNIINLGVWATPSETEELENIGFIDTNYTGHSPASSWKAGSGTRADMANMAIRTPDVGGAERQMTRQMENLAVGYDGAIYLFGKFVSFFAPPDPEFLTYIRKNELDWFNAQRTADYISDQLGVQRQIVVPEVEQRDIAPDDTDQRAIGEVSQMQAANAEGAEYEIDD